MLELDLVTADDLQKGRYPGAGRELSTSELVIGLYAGLAVSENLGDVLALNYVGSKVPHCSTDTQGLNLTR